MEKQILLDKLQSLVQRAVLVDEPMSKHTTWKIGGPADYYVRPSSKAELAALLKLIHQEGLPFIVIGNGSNLLVGDKGIRGVVIKMSGSYSRRIWREEGVEAQAGAMLPTLAIEAAERAFCGMEFAAGIPGSIGGARARDVRALIADVQKRVEDFSGIHLEPEVKFVGEF